MTSGPLAGEVALVTGGNGGIGLGMARGLAQAGAAVCIWGRDKDPEKSARTFPVILGRRYTVAGDYATVEADGSLRLLGRGSVCINTGGEKVFPEEVDEVVETHPAVHGVVVVRVPDRRFGQAIAAAVALVGGATDDELIAHVKAHLAGYKAPRHIVRADSVGRAPNGKADYPAAQAPAAEGVALDRSSR